MATKFVNNVDIHEILKQAAIYSYDINKNQIPRGYKLIKESKPSKTGFYACALKRGNEVIIAYRGTDDNQDKLGSDKQLLFKKMPEQRKEAQDFCKEVMSENKGCEFFATGHSLGGALAQIAGGLFNLPTATFNPAGVGSMLRRDPLKSYGENIINYHTPNDIITRIPWMFDDIGTNYVVDSNAHSMDIRGHHLAENMKPLRTAVPMTREPHKSTQEYMDITKNGIQSAINNVKSHLESAKSNIPQGFPVGFAAPENNFTGNYLGGSTEAGGTKGLGYQPSYETNGNSWKIRKKRIDEMTPLELDDFLERIL